MGLSAGEKREAGKGCNKQEKQPRVIINFQGGFTIALTHI